MENIDKISKIRLETLSGEYYFLSLLEQAYGMEMLSEHELERIQLDCLVLLAKRTERYNGGDSSSIRIEKAQDILASIIFTIGLQLKTYPCPDDSVIILQSEGIEALYQKGRQRIDTIMKRVKLLHRSLLPRLVETENVFYRITVERGIKGFFDLYNPDFGAHETHMLVDYPVYNKTEKLVGIEFIGQYLEQVYYENMFCSYFSEADLHHLHCGYNEQYPGLPFNLYEPVLAAALGCSFAGSHANRLEITPTIQDFLYRQFVGKEKEEIENMLITPFFELSNEFSFPTGLQEYVMKSLPLLVATIESAITREIFDRVFIIPRYPENDPKRNL